LPVVAPPRRVLGGTSDLASETAHHGDLRMVRRRQVPYPELDSAGQRVQSPPLAEKPSRVQGLSAPALLGENGLGCERDGSRSGECDRERGEHRQVGVKLDAGQTANAERAQAVLVLQSAEAPLDRATSTVE